MYYCVEQGSHAHRQAGNIKYVFKGVNESFEIGKIEQSCEIFCYNYNSNII